MREKIKLESSAGTGHFYTTTKNKRTTPDKLEILKFDPDPQLPHTVIDLNEVYAGQAESVTRACSLLPSRTGVVQDRLTGLKPGAKVRWAMVTFAKSCQAHGNDMVLTDGAKSVTVRAVAPAAVTS